MPTEEVAMHILGVLVLALATQESVTLPCAVPYECVSDVRFENASASWRLSFDRRFAGVYDIVHWRIDYDAGAPGEYLAQLVRPEGGRMHYRFFIRERRGVWYTLGIRKRWVWRSVPHPSAEQDVMTVRLRQLFAIAQALRQGADSATIRF